MAGELYARYLCSRNALGLKAGRPSAARDDRVSCIQAGELYVPILINLSNRGIVLYDVLLHLHSIFNGTNIYHGQYSQFLGLLKKYPPILFY